MLGVNRRHTRRPGVATSDSMLAAQRSLWLEPTLASSIRMGQSRSTLRSAGYRSHHETKKDAAIRIVRLTDVSRHHGYGQDLGPPLIWPTFPVPMDEAA